VPPQNAAATERQRLLADLFHALTQPLTSLRCSLELALHQPRTAEQYRENLGAALDLAEQVTRLVTGIRQLLQSDDPGEDCQVVALDTCLEDVVVDWLPVAQAAHVKLSLECFAPCPVRLEAWRLRQAIVHLLESALDSARAGGAVNIKLSAHDGEVVLQLTASPGSASPAEIAAAKPCVKLHDLMQRLELAIARGVLEAAGGRVHVEESQTGLCLQVRLALARRTS